MSFTADMITLAAAYRVLHHFLCSLHIVAHSSSMPTFSCQAVGLCHHSMSASKVSSAFLLYPRVVYPYALSPKYRCGCTNISIMTSFCDLLSFNVIAYSVLLWTIDLLAIQSHKTVCARDLTDFLRWLGRLMMCKVRAFRVTSALCELDCIACPCIFAVRPLSIHLEREDC